MIEKLNTKSVWEHLAMTTKPLVIYGMGNGADMVIAKLEKIGKTFDDIFASDKFVRGQIFHDKRVKKYDEICQMYDDFIILMGFAIHDDETLERVRQLSQKHEYYSLSMPIVNEDAFSLEYVKEHESEFDKAYEMLADEKSRATYISVLNFKITGDVRYLFECQSEKDEIYQNIFHLDTQEHFVDLGAYDGDTIEEFLSACRGEYSKITAFEPDEKNFKKMCKNTENVKNLTRHNLGAWDKRETMFFAKNAARSSRIEKNGVEVNFDSVDNVINEPITFLKMDIEGAEKNALIGAKNTINAYKPKLYVCAYHRNSDMYKLPSLIKSICSDYKIHFRHHPYIPAWESNFYCIID